MEMEPWGKVRVCTTAAQRPGAAQAPTHRRAGKSPVASAWRTLESHYVGDQTQDKGLVGPLNRVDSPGPLAPYNRFINGHAPLHTWFSFATPGFLVSGQHFPCWIKLGENREGDVEDAFSSLC